MLKCPPASVIWRFRGFGDGRGGLMWTTTANILNQQLRTVDKEFGLGGAVTLKTVQCYEMSQEQGPWSDGKIKLSLYLIN
jgi:hypothetical protein